MEDTITLEESPKVKVKKLHFLIHPGFLRDPATDGFFEIKADDDEVYAKWDSLLKSYINKAISLPIDEIMITMLHAEFGDLLDDFRQGKQYTKTLSDLKRILGKRMIALSGNNDIEKESSYLMAEYIANQWGYHFPRDVYSEAYGETLGVCVEAASQTANNSLGLIHKTVIKPEFTNDPDVTEKIKKRTLDLYDRLQFELNSNNPSR